MGMSVHLNPVRAQLPIAERALYGVATAAGYKWPPERAAA